MVDSADFGRACTAIGFPCTVQTTMGHRPQCLGGTRSGLSPGLEIWVAVATTRWGQVFRSSNCLVMGLTHSLK